MRLASCRGLFASLVAVALGGIVGCSNTDKAAEGEVAAKPASKDKHEHGEWWCDEHGVPEAICAQCEKSIAADLKAKGDWCKEHDRPDSQCFICHPDKMVEFAAQYEAKYGKKPPEVKLDGNEEGDHDHDHDEEKS